MLEEGLDPVSAIDHASIAKDSVKGSVDKTMRFYDEELRQKLLAEQEITGMMRSALEERQFTVYYQPQFNHSTGTMVGAEALVRWIHPEKGMIPPNDFIPIFERNGFITNLDSYVFEQVCAFLSEQIASEGSVVPISVNLTRYDIFSPGFIDSLEEIRKRYGVPAKYIRIELTEAAALNGSDLVNEVLDTLHENGYTIEMDDFGSGFSSLSVLKELDIDVVKLDMNFFRTEDFKQDRKSGIILSSIIRMMSWLQLPTIAEGVETLSQANFLKSIGCECIQGFLYSKAIPQEEFKELLDSKQTSRVIPNMKLIKTIDADKFWSSESIETLIFSNFIGGAAIFEYGDNGVEILRVNEKYLQELGMNLHEADVMNKDLLDFLDEENGKIFCSMLERALETDEEQECETWRTLSSQSCGEDLICIRSIVRAIGKNENSAVFYATIRNITAEKLRYKELYDHEQKLRAASEHAQVYSWEYMISTHEMRPCFRCMRDLGLPPLLTDYPESAIERGIFPPEVADTYRDWIRQIDEGTPIVEGIIPLTMQRVPHHVRLVTVFDEFGNPVKAYGSAKPVQD